jgi:hypothetical protein
MEFTKEEIDTLRQTFAEPGDSEFNQLNELQLSTVAGGIGEVTFG